MNASEFSKVSTKEQRIAQLAKQAPGMVFTSLAHNLDTEWLLEAYRRTNKNKAAGVDGVTGKEYEANLVDNLQDLLERVKSGRYHAPPVRRTYIPKGPDEVRPIGIPTLEDKILQRAVCMILEPLFEQDFHDHSYGFRPKRSPHQAISSIRSNLMQTNGGWVIDVDIRKYFDTIDHSKIQAMLRQRVNDGVITRLVGKWLNAGVQEDGNVQYPEFGSPQGGVISPLLSNIYLHHVVDDWFVNVVRPLMRGQTFMARFADDMIMGFDNKQDALRVMAVLPKRFAKYGLTLHPEKTRLVCFDKPREASSGDKPDTFDFLGFTHYWARSLQGKWVVKRKTASKRMSAKLKAIGEWCRDNRHRSLKEQQEVLRSKLRGHYNYYGIAGNYRSLSSYRYAVTKLWKKWLYRRSRKGRKTWDTFNKLLRLFPLPSPSVVHPNI